MTRIYPGFEKPRFSAQLNKKLPVHIKEYPPMLSGGYSLITQYFCIKYKVHLYLDDLGQFTFRSYFLDWPIIRVKIKGPIKININALIMNISILFGSKECKVLLSPHPR